MKHADHSGSEIPCPEEGFLEDGIYNKRILYYSPGVIEDWFVQVIVYVVQPCFITSKEQTKMFVVFR
ncbi:hypothetical protein ACTJJ0_03525 [Chitinophaga sp. 22321]|uniref:hypothetical protein n=1 Tax=Chitinophaga hostae TaxID=2831022 RepID=UPI0031FE8676